jgi:formylglycine-generating enzyme required for sulfatase activity
MRDARLVAIPLVVLLAVACDNSLLVARSTTDAEAGAGGDLGDGSSVPGDDAAPNEAAPGDGTTGDEPPPLEGTPGDANAEGGGNGSDGAVGSSGGDTGTGEASADAGATEAASEASAGGEGGTGGDAGAGDGGATAYASTADAASDAAEAGTTPDAATDAGTDAPSESGSTNPYGPSCDGLANTCGPSHNESCCKNSVIPGGNFNRDNNSSYPATVDTFVLDRFEVTVGRFRKFQQAYPASQPAGGAGINSNVSSDPGWDAKWNASNYTVQSASALDSAIRNTNTSSIWIDWELGDDDLPINCIDWYEAYMFCIWDGGRLPTELEWNYAAAGGSEQRPYPWGSATADYPLAVFDSNTNPATVYAEVGSCSPQGDAKWGQADMAGNVMEWVEDWSTGGYPATCVDCANVPWNDTIVSPNPYRQTRGGSAADYPSQITTYTRWYYNVPNFRIDNIGVRCARNP